MKTGLFSYCKMHGTYPQGNEPCWACIRQFSGGELNPSDSIAAENQENTKPCRVDKVTLCVQHPDDDCDCDPCEDCGVRLTYLGNLERILRDLIACWNEDEIYSDSKSFKALKEAKELLRIEK